MARRFHGYVMNLIFSSAAEVSRHALNLGMIAMSCFALDFSVLIVLVAYSNKSYSLACGKWWKKQALHMVFQHDQSCNDYVRMISLRCMRFVCLVVWSLKFPRVYSLPTQIILVFPGLFGLAGRFNVGQCQLER